MSSVTVLNGRLKDTLINYLMVMRVKLMFKFAVFYRQRWYLRMSKKKFWEGRRTTNRGHKNNSAFVTPYVVSLACLLLIVPKIFFMNQKRSCFNKYSLFCFIFDTVYNYTTVILCVKTRSFVWDSHVQISRYKSANID